MFSYVSNWYSLKWDLEWFLLSTEASVFHRWTWRDQWFPVRPGRQGSTISFTLDQDPVKERDIQNGVQCQPLLRLYTQGLASSSENHYLLTFSFSSYYYSCPSFKQAPCRNSAGLVRISTTMLPHKYSKTPALKVALFYSYPSIIKSAGVWLIQSQLSHFVFSCSLFLTLSLDQWASHIMFFSWQGQVEAYKASYGLELEMTLSLLLAFHQDTGQAHVKGWRSVHSKPSGKGHRYREGWRMGSTIQSPTVQSLASGLLTFFLW